MDKESANWCRIAHTIVQKGGEVLRQFLILEILTQSFNMNSQYWMENVHNPCKISLDPLLSHFMIMSRNHRDRILDKLLQSWRAEPNKQIAMIKQIELLKQWKNDIENERKNSMISSSVDATFDSWLKLIENEIARMTPLCTFVSRLNDTFHDHLKNSQSSLLLEIEKNDGFLSHCSKQLRSLSMSSRCEFQQLVQNFKTELNSWKGKCRKIFQEFNNKCHILITKGLTVAKTFQNGYRLEKFLYFVLKEIEGCTSESQVDTFCASWDDGLHKLFDIYERKIQEDDLPESILKLTQNLREELENISSFKETKIIHFFHSFNPSSLPRYLECQVSKLKQISSSLELNECDLTTLFMAFRHGNLVHSSLKDWNDDQHDWDKSITADIQRLRKFKLNIVDHIAQVRISSDNFEILWKELTMLLRRIASRCGDEFSMRISWEIDQMKDPPLEPHKQYELRKEFLTWCKKDILSQLSARNAATYICRDLLQPIQTALENLSRSRQACTCCICHKEFSTESELAEHMRLHQDCRCLSCKKTFSQGSDLTNHMKCHQDRACRICKMDCSTEWEFRRHMWCNQDCRCPGCDEAFLSESVFEEHITYHKALKCNICKKGYPTELEFYQHMLCHQARTCLSCKKDFPNENEFEQHIRSHEARTCRSCKKNFSTPIELENHMKCHQDRTCRSCNMDFSTEIELEIHIEYHQVRTCRDCVKEFSTVTELEEHMKYHQGPASAVSSVSKSNDRDQDQTAEEEEPRKNGQKKKRHSLDST